MLFPVIVMVALWVLAFKLLSLKSDIVPKFVLATAGLLFFSWVATVDADARGTAFIIIFLCLIQTIRSVRDMRIMVRND